MTHLIHYIYGNNKIISEKTPKGTFYMHHPTDSTAPTAIVTLVMEH